MTLQPAEAARDGLASYDAALAEVRRRKIARGELAPLSMVELFAAVPRLRRRIGRGHRAARDHRVTLRRLDLALVRTGELTGVGIETLRLPSRPRGIDARRVNDARNLAYAAAALAAPAATWDDIADALHRQDGSTARQCVVALFARMAAHPPLRADWQALCARWRLDPWTARAGGS